MLLSIRFGSSEPFIPETEVQEELLLTILFRIPADDTNPESGLLLLEEELFSAVVVAALVFLSLLFFFLILGVLLPSLVSRFWSSGII